MRESGTQGRIRPSSLCRKVSLTLPTGWQGLSQDDLRHVLLLHHTLGGRGTDAVKAAALLYFGGFLVERKTESGWLCVRSGKPFLLSPSLLPSVIATLDWTCRPEEMTDRIDRIGRHKACNMWLRDMPFGKYLMLENYYQAFLSSREARLLRLMAEILYQVPEGDTLDAEDYETSSVFLWYSAVKSRFAREFPHFLKPVREGQSTGSRMDQKEMMTAQIRLLTKGDITKNDAILNTDTWSALFELDALARESEELKTKNSTRNV